jgi:hypothetical protein
LCAPALRGASPDLPGPGLDIPVDADGDGVSTYGDRHAFNYWLELGGSLADALASAEFGKDVIDLSKFFQSHDALLAPRVEETESVKEGEAGGGAGGGGVRLFGKNFNKPNGVAFHPSGVMLVAEEAPEPGKGNVLAVGGWRNLFRRGDANGDGIVNITDGIKIANWAEPVGAGSGMPRRRRCRRQQRDPVRGPRLHLPVPLQRRAGAAGARPLHVRPGPERRSPRLLAERRRLRHPVSGGDMRRKGLLASLVRSLVLSVAALASGSLPAQDVPCEEQILCPSPYCRTSSSWFEAEDAAGAVGDVVGVTIWLHFAPGFDLEFNGIGLAVCHDPSMGEIVGLPARAMARSPERRATARAGLPSPSPSATSTGTACSTSRW